VNWIAELIRNHNLIVIRKINDWKPLKLKIFSIHAIPVLWTSIIKQNINAILIPNHFGVSHHVFGQ